jgi:hypothetical protein
MIADYESFVAGKLAHHVPTGLAGDVVWSPFMGIGSEGFVALQAGRRFVGAELKTSYYEQAVRNLREAATVKQAARARWIRTTWICRPTGRRSWPRCGTRRRGRVG